MTTEKQQAFAMRLYTELQKVAPNLSEEDAKIMSETLGDNKDTIAQVLQGEGNNGVASRAVDVLKSLVEDSKKRTGVVEYRWTKFGDEWVITGPDLVEGMKVTVVSRRGEQETVIGSVVDGFGYPVKEKIPSDIKEGLWRNKDDEIIEIARTRNNQLVGKLVDPESGKRVYRGKHGLKDLVSMLSYEEAQAYGRKTGVCCVCGIELTNDHTPGPDGLTSVERGVGPVCMFKF